MRISFIADVHIDNFAQFGGPQRGGLNDRARYVLQALGDAANKASGYLVVLGDLFNRCQPSPVLISRTQDILNEHSDVTLLVGNHDQETGAYGHHALAPLSTVADVVEEPRIQWAGHNQRFWFVPFQPGKALDWLPDVLETLLESEKGRKARPTMNILCLHMGISDARTPYYLDATAGSIDVKTLVKLVKPYGITHVFAGDWHRHQRWYIDGVHVCQVGALCPSRFPPNYEHGDRGPMVTLEYNGNITVEDIPGPRFYKLRWSQVKDKGGWLPTDDARPAYVRLTCRSDQVDEAKTWLESLRVELGLLVDGGRLGGAELDVDRGIDRAKARTASYAVRKASSLDEAISLYVKKMPLEDGVDRDAVRRHAQRLLGKK